MANPVRASRFKWSEWDDSQTISLDEEGMNKQLLLKHETLGFGGLFGRTRPRRSFGRRDSRCARCIYIVERWMVDYGRAAQILLLLCAGFVQVAIYGLVYSLVWRYEDSDVRDEKRVSPYIEGWWAAWTFMADGGTHAKAYHAEQRIIGGLISIMGIIYLATILAFIVDMVREKMNDMRVGKGQVHEKNHTVILNWTDRTIPLLAELCIANESEGGGVLVVLARDAVETMKTELSLQLPEFVRRGTKIVLRHGNPAVISDLIKVSVDRAKAIVCLASGKTAGEADSATLRCILSIKSMGYPLKGHIVAEVADGESESLMKLIGSRLIETCVVHDMIGHLLLMSVRQPGLANVYDTLLGFEGNEIYMKSWPELAGATFGELSERFPDAIPIGVRRVAGELRLNPSRDFQLLHNDQLIVIAEDDDTYKPEVPADVTVGSLPSTQVQASFAERFLICGWRRDIREILNLLDNIVRRKSEVHIMSPCVPAAKRNELLRDDGLVVEELRNITVVHHDGNPSVRRRLEMLPLETYSSCLIFADQAYEDDTMQADSHSLATLVLIRDIQAQRRNTVKCPITCEILDLRTQRTISGQKQLGWISDFVQSNKFVARIMAMIAENRSVISILSQFLAAQSCNLLLVPSNEYIFPEEEVSFWTVAKRVQLKGAILLGFQSTAWSRETSLNPPDKLNKRRWEKDNLIVISGENLQGGSKQHSADDVPTSKFLEGDETVSVDVLSKVGEGESSGSSALARALEASPIHLQELDCLELEDDLTNEFHAPDEGGICASADKAMQVLTALADHFARLRTKSEQQHLGSMLVDLGLKLQEGEL